MTGYTKADWHADYLRAGDYKKQRLTLLAEARDHESLGEIDAAKDARAQAREFHLLYHTARSEADAKFYSSRG